MAFIPETVETDASLHESDHSANGAAQPLKAEPTEAERMRRRCHELVEKVKDHGLWDALQSLERIVEHWDWEPTPPPPPRPKEERIPVRIVESIQAPVYSLPED